MMNEEKKATTEEAERATLMLKALTLLSEATPEQIALILEEVRKWGVKT